MKDNILMNIFSVLALMFLFSAISIPISGIIAIWGPSILAWKIFATGIVGVFSSILLGIMVLMADG